jgi:hypothetical protein
MLRLQLRTHRLDFVRGPVSRRPASRIATRSTAAKGKVSRIVPRSIPASRSLGWAESDLRSGDHFKILGTAPASVIVLVRQHGAPPENIFPGIDFEPPQEKAL